MLTMIDETEANKWLHSITVIHCILIVVRFLTSIATGTVLVRISCWTVMVVQTCIFSFSLRRIRSLIASMKPDDLSDDESQPSFETNVPLLRCN